MCNDLPENNLVTALITLLKQTHPNTLIWVYLNLMQSWTMQATSPTVWRHIYNKLLNKKSNIHGEDILFFVLVFMQHSWMAQLQKY